MQEVPHRFPKEMGWSVNLTGFQMQFDEFINVILWPVHSSCVPLLSYKGAGLSSKNVERRLLK